MAWRPLDQVVVQSVTNSEAAHALVTHRLAENARQLSEDRVRSYAITFDSRDPLHVGSIGRFRGVKANLPILPEIGSVWLTYTYEVFDGDVILRENLLDVGPLDALTDDVTLAPTNGITTLRRSLDVTAWQRGGWSPRGCPVSFEINSETSGSFVDYPLVRSNSNAEELALVGDAFGDLLNPLGCYSVDLMDSVTKQVAGSLPKTQVIETVELSGKSLVGATIAAGGTNYRQGDTLSVPGGTPILEARFTVTAIGVGGDVTAVEVDFDGLYTVVPSSPAATDTTSNAGAGCTLTLLFNESLVRVWPPIESDAAWFVDHRPVDTVRLTRHGRIKIYSIMVEEVEEASGARWSVQNGPDIFPIKEAYEVKRTIQPGYGLRDQSHSVVYRAGENLLEYRTAVHSMGPRTHGEFAPGGESALARISIHPTQGWKPTSAGYKSLFACHFGKEDHYKNQAGTKWERRIAEVHAEVLFFAAEQSPLSVEVKVAMIDRSGSIIGSSSTLVQTVDPITTQEGRGDFATYEEHIHCYYRVLDEFGGQGGVGSRNNLQGLHETSSGGSWGDLDTRIMRISRTMLIPDIAVALAPFIEVSARINGTFAGNVKAVVLWWHVTGSRGRLTDAMGRS